MSPWGPTALAVSHVWAACVIATEQFCKHRITVKLVQPHIIGAVQHRPLHCARSDCSVSEWSLWNATASWSTGGSAAVAAAEAENQAVPTTEGQALKRIEAAQRQARKVGNAYVPVVYLDSNGHACSAECGGGVQFRNRTITRKAKHGGRACPSLSQQRSCNTAPCTKRNCTVGPWNNASTAECSRSCGRGRKTRPRSVLWQARGGGKPCPPLYLVEDCNVWSCPQNCVVSQWSAWKPA